MEVDGDCSGGISNFAYDASGDLISSSSDSYAWNEVSGNLCWSLQGESSNSCAVPPAGSTTYLYDALGFRMTESPSDAEPIQFDWDQTTANLLSDGTWNYVYGPTGDAPIEQIASTPSGGSTTSDLLVADQTGSVRGLVRLTGSSDVDVLTNYTDYDSYGVPIMGSGLATEAGGLTVPQTSIDSEFVDWTPFGFEGEYTDQSGLLYTPNQYYNPQTAQYIDAGSAGQEMSESDPEKSASTLDICVGDYWGPEPVKKYGSPSTYSCSKMGYGTGHPKYNTGCPDHEVTTGNNNQTANNSQTGNNLVNLNGGCAKMWDAWVYLLYNEQSAQYTYSKGKSTTYSENFSRIAAAGILGVLMTQDPSLDPSDYVGDPGGASACDYPSGYGLAQWTNVGSDDRDTFLYQYAEDHKQNCFNFTFQLEYLLATLWGKDGAGASNGAYETEAAIPLSKIPNNTALLMDPGTLGSGMAYKAISQAVSYFGKYESPDFGTPGPGHSQDANWAANDGQQIFTQYRWAGCSTKSYCRTAVLSQSHQ